jgi:hypothetical protein
VRAFDSESAEVVRRTSSAAAVASACFLAFAPLLAIIGQGARPLELLLMAVLSSMGILFLLWMRRPGRQFLAMPVLVIHVLIIAVVSHLYTPFFLGPGTAAVVAMGFMTGPQYAKRQATWVATIAFAGVMLPFLAEQIGWFPQSFEVGDGFAVIRSPLFHGGPSTFAVMTLFTAALIGSCVVMTRGLKTAERSARQHMHLQAWQLRQLVASPA